MALSEAKIRARIARTHRQLALWSAGSFTATTLLAWIAAASYGPAADVVHVLGGFAGLATFIFGTMFFSSFSNGRAALRDLPYFQNDPGRFERIHGGAMRIPWR